MYWQPPTAEQLAKYRGARRIEDYPEPQVGVWEENWGPIKLFTEISDQWRYAMNGPVAFDYNVLHRELDDHNITGEERDEWKAKFRIIVREALKQLHDP